MGKIAIGLTCAVLGMAGAVAVGPRPSDARSSGFATVASTRGGIVNDGGPLNLQRGTDAVVETYTLQPGGTTGWHTHPGAAIFVVTEGQLTSYGVGPDPCRAETISTGEAYVVPAAHAGHPHLVRNEGSTPARTVVSYPSLPAGAPVAKEVPAPPECPAALR